MKYLILFLSLFLFACEPQVQTEEEKAAAKDTAKHTVTTSGDTTRITLNRDAGDTSRIVVHVQRDTVYVPVPVAASSVDTIYIGRNEELLYMYDGFLLTKDGTGFSDRKYRRYQYDYDEKTKKFSKPTLQVVIIPKK